jgi:hypothetical protein
VGLCIVMLSLASSRFSLLVLNGTCSVALHVQYVLSVCNRCVEWAREKCSADLVLGLQIILCRSQWPRVYGRSLAGIAVSNPSRGIDICVVCCTINDKGTSQGTHDKGKSTEKYKEVTREGIRKTKTVMFFS